MFLLGSVNNTQIKHFLTKKLDVELNIFVATRSHHSVARNFFQLEGCGAIFSLLHIRLNCGKRTLSFDHVSVVLPLGEE